jgi:hypothetical protein
MANPKSGRGKEPAALPKRTPRIKSINLVSYARHNESLKVDEDGGVARTVNLSESGILLETYSPLPLESVIEIDISLGDRLITVTGEVMRAESVDRGVYRLGIRFREPNTAAGRKALKDFLAARKG